MSEAVVLSRLLHLFKGKGSMRLHDDASRSLGRRRKKKTTCFLIFLGLGAFCPPFAKRGSPFGRMQRASIKKRGSEERKIVN